MLKTFAVAAVVLFAIACLGGGSIAAEYKDAKLLLGRLKDSRISLADGLKQAEAAHGFAISAKFEMKKDTLMLSVYTAKEGRDKDAEHNVLMELLGNATSQPWAPETEVFEDKPHIARSAMHLTLVQIAKLSLPDAIKKAEATQPGTVYSAIPAVRRGRPVADVLVATPDNKSVHFAVDLLNGIVSK